MQDEIRLLARARALDQEALTQIHDVYYGPIFRYIVLKVSDHDTAEDLTSEVFLRLLNALRDRTAPDRTLRGWLYAVASRVVSDHYRRHYRAPLTAISEEMPDQALEPAELVYSRLTWQQVQGLMQELTAEQQEVLALRFGYEMSIRDVAEVLNKSEGAVKQLQARAIASLARLLGAENG